MIYEYIERLKDSFKAIVHFFRAMFCRQYRQGGCALHVEPCRYWNCPRCNRETEKESGSDEGMEQKSMKERVKTIIWAALISISVAVMTWMALDTWKYANPDPKSMQVTDKYEMDGKCYIQTWTE